MTTNKLLEQAKDYAVQYLNDLPSKRVGPTPDALKKLDQFSMPLPEDSKAPEEVIELLNSIGSQNTMASTGARYFGFVLGGVLPAALAANWLASTWDQNAVMKVSSPIAARLESVAGKWMLDLLSLPKESAVGFVTGTTMGNFTAMLAARQAIYSRLGWNIKTKGISGAPAIRVVVSEEIHASMLRALMFAGFGTENLIRVPTDDQGRIMADQMPELDDKTIVCLQAGNVNTGALDPVKAICTIARETGAWVHIDGAFGLWARATAAKSHLVEGCELADSWAIDLHKWLNVPYDSGLVICRDPQTLEHALSISAAYLLSSGEPDAYYYTPEMSRRARGIDTWAAIYSLGRSGVAEMIDRCCENAMLFANKLQAAGIKILNEVCINQVLVSFGDAETTNLIIKKIQDDGTCWCGGTVWKGITAMRISVSSWMTTAQDVEVSAEAIIRIAMKEMHS